MSLWGEMSLTDTEKIVVDGWYSKTEGPMRGSVWVRCKFVGGRRDGETRDVPIVPALATVADEMPRA